MWLLLILTFLFTILLVYYRVMLKNYIHKNQHYVYLYSLWLGLNEKF